MGRDGWRHLAEMLRGLREARWSHLPPEATAQEVWPRFRDAVMAAADEEHMDAQRAAEQPPEGVGGEDPPAGPGTGAPSA